MTGSATADTIFLEDFGTLADGTSITTANTNFDYRRVGSGGGAIVAQNPSSFSGASMSLGGSNSGSLNGVGVKAGLGNNDFIGFSFDFRTSDSSLGDLVIVTGQGGTFTGNSTFSTNDLFFGVQFDNGDLEYRTNTAGGSATWNSAGFNISDNTDYKIEIFANGSGGDINYGSGTVADGKMDIVINGSSVVNEGDFNNRVQADAFRIYQVNGQQEYEIDNITLMNQISSVPEPGALMTFGLLMGLAGTRRRRQVA